MGGETKCACRLSSDKYTVKKKKSLCNLGLKCLDTDVLPYTAVWKWVVKLARPVVTWMMNWHSWFNSSLTTLIWTCHSSDSPSLFFFPLWCVSLEHKKNLPQPFIRNLKEKSTQTCVCTLWWITGHNDVTSRAVSVFILVFNRPSQFIHQFVNSCELGLSAYKCRYLIN